MGAEEGAEALARSRPRVAWPSSADGRWRYVPCMYTEHRVAPLCGAVTPLRACAPNVGVPLFESGPSTRGGGLLAYAGAAPHALSPNSLCAWRRGPCRGLPWAVVLDGGVNHECVYSRRHASVEVAEPERGGRRGEAAGRRANAVTVHRLASDWLETDIWTRDDDGRRGESKTCACVP